MHSYILFSKYEQARAANLAVLRSCLPHAELVDAIYATQQKIPFLQKAIDISGLRTGTKLLAGEIGCLLSHRSIWRKILQSPGNASEHFLILESDSKINHLPALKTLLDAFDSGDAAMHYDLFFYGAWDGNMQLFRSTQKNWLQTYTIGEPFIKSIYCTYGYSLNKKTAAFLLKRTGLFGYPVDQFKRFFLQEELKLGGIVPELVGTCGAESYIRKKQGVTLVNYVFLALLSIKNKVICFFK